MRPDLAGPLSALATEVVRFGPRTQAPRRNVATWQIIDYLLPSDPTSWAPVR
jgi:hypothetical protein